MKRRLLKFAALGASSVTGVALILVLIFTRLPMAASVIVGALAVVSLAIPGVFALRRAQYEWAARRRRKVNALARVGMGIRDEYRTWALADRLLQTANRGHIRSRIRIEGWISKNFDPDAAPPFYPLRGALANVTGLRRDLQREQIPDADAIADDIEKLVTEALRNPEAFDPVDAVVEDRGDVLTYGSFVLPATERVRELVSIGGAEAVLRMGLRYASMLAGAFHWAVPPAVFELMWEEGFRNEAFASPMNSGVLGRSGSRFFTLFHDVDSPFGSFGDWFSHSLPAVSSIRGGWEINPPFLAKILDRAARRGAALSRRQDVLFITRAKDFRYSATSPYGAFEAVATASRILEDEQHVYAVQSPEGLVYRRPNFPTHLLYAGPRPLADAELLLDALVAAWPNEATPYPDGAEAPAGA